MNPIIFVILSIVTVGAALMVILSRSPVNSILFLLLAFFGIAAFYVLLGAQFLAAVQIIVYIGAILVLFLFAVMLLNIGKIQEQGKTFLKVLGIAAGGFIFILFANIFNNSYILQNPAPEMTTTASLGDLLFTKYILPFELASVLLLVAIVGAVTLVKRKSN